MSLIRSFSVGNVSGITWNTSYTIHHSRAWVDLWGVVENEVANILFDVPTDSKCAPEKWGFHSFTIFHLSKYFDSWERKLASVLNRFHTPAGAFAHHQMITYFCEIVGESLMRMVIVFIFRSFADGANWWYVYSFWNEGIKDCGPETCVVCWSTL